MAARVANEGDNAPCRRANRCQPGESEQEPEAQSGNLRSALDVAFEDFVSKLSKAPKSVGDSL